MTLRWVGLLVLTAIAAQAGASHAVGRDALPFYGDRDFTPRWSGTSHRVGHFSLTLQDGKAVGDRDFEGRVYVAGFIYTRCSGICPTLVANLRRAQLALGDRDVSFVVFSVTPDLDTPDVLTTFARDHHLDRAHWTLVTGDRSEIYRLARESFFADDDRVAATLSDPNAFLHTEKIFLVDAAGHLRGVYDGTQPFEIDKLVEDATNLLTQR